MKGMSQDSEQIKPNGELYKKHISFVKKRAKVISLYSVQKLSDIEALADSIYIARKHYRRKE